MGMPEKRQVISADGEESGKGRAVFLPLLQAVVLALFLGICARSLPSASRTATGSSTG